MINTLGWSASDVAMFVGVVGLGHRLDVAGLEAEALARLDHRVVRVLVERAVVDFADVGDEAHVEAVGRGDAVVLRLLAHLVEGWLPPRRRRYVVSDAAVVVVFDELASSSSSSPPHAAEGQVSTAPNATARFSARVLTRSSSPRAPIGTCAPQVGGRHYRRISPEDGVRPDHGSCEAAAISAATSALCSASARLAGTVRPPVAASIAARTRGVTAAPRCTAGGR